eukprot:gb/GFBE01063493.1/.p1 GENE.gb/GFBE01063493.1/~~gb/GFBE01063493.1/.p1  ORF type:complete len:553 (+),score=110.23 gb/GFBE01063493.1/:1-1659(+)
MSRNRVDAADAQNAALLCLAAVQGDIGQLQKLLGTGISVNSCDYDRRTGLHVAAAEGTVEVVEFLLSRGADITLLDRWGHRPVDEASLSGHEKVRDILLKASLAADPDAMDRETSGMETAAMLCAAAASASIPTLQKLLASRADPCATDYDGRTALHVAAARSHVQVVELLLQARASFTIRDSFNRTPVDEALRCGEPNVLRALVAAGANDGEANASKNMDLEVLKAAAANEQWAIPAGEVHFGKCISTTIKSAVHIATWRGTKVVAKTIKDVASTGLDPGHEASENTKKASREELLHEIRTLSTLRHPDLVLFLGASLDTNVYFFMTEFMEGGDVENYMQVQRLKSSSREFKPPKTVAMAWFSSIARALGFLHACTRPIIHRDLKPLNLLLTRSLDLKVTDFGLSKIMRPQIMQTALQDDSLPPAPKMSGGVGTYRYMAPEVVRYEQYTDRIDVYAFALIMYFICSGKLPFYDTCGSDPELILKAYIRGEEPRPTLNSSIGTSELRELMKDAWAVEPAQRPSAQECVERLSRMPSSSSPMRVFGGFFGCSK